MGIAKRRRSPASSRRQQTRSLDLERADLFRVQGYAAHHEPNKGTGTRKSNLKGVSKPCNGY